MFHDEVLTVGDSGVAANDEFYAPLQSVVLDGQPGGGQITNWDGLGGFTYVPDPGEYGSVRFPYHDVAVDGQSSNQAFVLIHISESAPIASGISYDIYHDQVLTVSPAGVLTYASDRDPPDMGNLTALLVSGPTVGKLSDYIDAEGIDHPLLVDGSFDYTPPPSFFGTVTFQFEVTDGILNSDPYTVTINVMENAPSASDVGFDMYHDQVLTVSPAGVLLNATDPDPPDMGHLTARLVSGPNVGKLSDYINEDGIDHPLLVDGSFDYTPPPKYFGTVTFQFNVTDGILTSGPYTATINVIENAPDDLDPAYSILHDHVLTVGPAGVLLDATDPDPPDMGNLTASLVSQPSAGKLSDYVDDNGVDHPLIVDGSFVYTPPPHWAGTVTFQFNITDGILTSGPYTAIINVTDQAPVANPDGWEANPVDPFWRTNWNRAAADNETVTQNVLLNDTDADGDALTPILLTQPGNGTLTLTKDPNTGAWTGEFTYKPNVGFGGYDTFTYKVNDGVVDSQPATVKILVEKVKLDIADALDGTGYGGNYVPDAKYKTRGAYTVVNTNDTNGDGTFDAKENLVEKTPIGRDEVDLMKLRINQPVPMPDPNAMVTIVLLYPGMKLWSDDVKKTELDNGGNYSIRAGAIPAAGAVVYVELTLASTALRDQQISAQYSNYGWSRVYATAISASVKLYSANQSAADVEAAVGDITSPQPKGLLEQFQTTGNAPYQWGGSPSTQLGIREAILFQFTITPSRGPNDGTWEGDGVMFDATQQTESSEYTAANFLSPWVQSDYKPFPTVVEDANDDGNNTANSVVPTPAGHYYQYDSPGMPKNPSQVSYNYWEMRANYNTWLRVSYNGAVPAGNGVVGTLVPGSSIQWCMALTIKDDGSGAWARTTWTTNGDPQVPGVNSIGPGQLDVNDPKNNNGVSP